MIRPARTRSDTLPLQTRLALLVLLGGSLAVLFWLLAFQFRPEPTPPARVAPAVIAPKSTPVVPEIVQAVVSENTGRAASLAEIELIAALLRDERGLRPPAALQRLARLLQSDDETVRTVAQYVAAPLRSNANAQARSAARAAAESALDLTEAGDFPAAIAALEKVAKELPESAEWSPRGREQLETLRSSIVQKRQAQRDAVLAGAEKAWRENPSDGTLNTLLNHPDASFRESATMLKLKLEDEAARRRAKGVEQQRKEGLLRVGWLGFFEHITAAINEGDLDEAEKLCKPMQPDALLTGGVSDPEKVFQSCALEVAAVRALHEAILVKAKRQKKVVVLPLRRGQIEGTLDGVDGRQIFVTVSGAARVAVKIESLSATAIQNIFEYHELVERGVVPALWALFAYENPASAQATLTRNFTQAKLQIPLHWQERFKLERYRRADQDAGKHVMAIKQAVDSGKPEAVKAAIDDARTAIAAFEEYEPLSDVRQGIVGAALKIMGASERQRIVLQTGVQPDPAYAGLVTDQISQYKESARRSDVGVQFGLKVGASGGLQRVLVRFDGLEAAIGKRKVKRAMLEFYQIDSPQFSGAEIGLFRLRRAWTPDNGTWISFDAARKADWTAPGANSEADAAPKEESSVKLDAKKNEWRAWDVTQYVNEVLAGKAQNNGLLMRVTNAEPDFHVRFYPETDLEAAAAKDKSLRPRLILDLASE